MHPDCFRNVETTFVVRRCRCTPLCDRASAPGCHGNRFRHRRPSAALNRRSGGNQIRFGNVYKNKWLTVPSSTYSHTLSLFFHFKSWGSSSQSCIVDETRGTESVTVLKDRRCAELWSSGRSNTRRSHMTDVTTCYRVAFTGCWTSCSTLTLIHIYGWLLQPDSPAKPLIIDPANLGEELQPESLWAVIKNGGYDRGAGYAGAFPPMFPLTQTKIIFQPGLWVQSENTMPVRGKVALMTSG